MWCGSTYPSTGLTKPDNVGGMMSVVWFYLPLHTHHLYLDGFFCSSFSTYHQDGSEFIRFQITWCRFVHLQGFKGEMGNTGLPGEPGRGGSDGPQGPPGAPGLAGINGDLVCINHFFINDIVHSSFLYRVLRCVDCIRCYKLLPRPLNNNVM